jgi:hypothetical protein
VSSHIVNQVVPHPKQERPGWRIAENVDCLYTGNFSA